MARDRLFYASVVALAGWIVFLACVWTAYPDVAVPITNWSLLLGLFTISLLLLAHGKRIPVNWLPAAGSALFFGLHVVLLYSLIQTRGPAFTLFLAMVVLGAGILQGDTRWLVGKLLVGVGSWVVVGLALFGASFAPMATGLVFSAFIALLLHLFVRRYLAHLEGLRKIDRIRSQELTEALAAAQRELTERQRAEAERERLREQLLHSQKLEAIGTLAGGVAHDMNNVLAVIVGFAELAVQDPRTAQEGAQKILEAARRGIDLSRNLLGFSRRGKYRKERFEPSSVVAGMAALLSRTLPKEIEVATSNTATHRVEGDIAQLGQALLNLCLNASDAMNGRGVLRIDVDEVLLDGERARALGLPDGLYVRLVVSDTGCGMDPATRSRMFEPFFTTKEQGRGTGLGLAMVYGTIANHGGAIAVDSERGRGTAVTLHLPAVEAAAQSPAASAPAAAARPVPSPTPVTTVTASTATADPPAAAQAQAATGRPTSASGTILVVDDEPLVRSVTKRSLERAGYQVITACDGAEGVMRYMEHAAEISVVVLDMAMPVMGGAECFRRLRAFDPNVRVLLASGYALEEDARACLAAGALGFLEKPVTTAHLLEAIALARRDRRVPEPFMLPAVS